MNTNKFPNSVNVNAGTNFPFTVLKVDNGQMQPRTRGFRVAHWHDDLQFTYVRKGKMELQTLDYQAELEAGEAAFFNTRVVHMVKTDFTGSYSNIIFPAYFLYFYTHSPVADLLQQFIGNNSFPFYILQPEADWQQECLSILQHLLELEATRPSFYAYEVLLQLNQLWLVLCSHITPPAPQKANLNRLRMEKFIDYLEQHYAEDFSITELAAAAHVSKAECIRCFHSGLNTTPYKYLTELRIAKAVALLRTTDLPITEIAASVGFNQLSNFGKVFRENTNYTPREYRKLSKE